MSSRCGGGASGETNGRAHAARSSAAVTTPRPTLLLVVVDPTVRLDEPDDPLLVELLERVDARPRGQRDPALHRRVRRQDHVPVVAPYDRAELLDELRAFTIVLDEHAAVLEVVHLERLRNRARVHAPRRDVRQVWARGRRVGIVGLMRDVGGRDVEVPLVGHLHTGQVRGGPVGEVSDDHGDDDHPRRDERPPLPARHPPARAWLPIVLGPSLLRGGSVWDSHPSTVCLERSTGFEVREAHRVPRRFRHRKYASMKRYECTTAATAPIKGGFHDRLFSLPSRRRLATIGAALMELAQTGPRPVRPTASPWWLGGLSLQQLARRVYRRVSEDEILDRAAGLSYYFAFALLPGLLFLTVLVGLLPFPDLMDQLLGYADRMLPGDAASLLRKTLAEIVSGASGGLLSIGVVAALWAASSGMLSIMTALNVASRVSARRSWWESRLVAVGLTIGFSLFTLTALLLLVRSEERR